MFEEDKDDSLSRLFRNSKTNLEEDLPSDMVWSRIEQRLDNTPTMRIEKAPSSSLWKTIRPYAAAASLLAGVLTVVAIWQTFDSLSNPSPAIADTRNSDAVKSNVELQAEPLAATEDVFEKEEEQQTMELRAQKAVIVDKKEHEPVEILLESAPVPTIEPFVASTTTNAPAPAPAKASATNEDSNNEDNARSTTIAESGNVLAYSVESKKDKATNANNYGIAPVPQADDINTIVKNEASYSNTYAPHELKRKLADDSRANDLRSRSQNASKEDLIQSKLAPRLRLFGWLVGKWEDKLRYDGYSYEEWTIKDANTLQGRGFKFKGTDRVFEERMSIFFDEKLQQVFMSMHIDDFKEPVLYMLSGINPEELTFTLDQNGAYPEKVVLQRTINGYSVAIMNGSNTFSTNQQTFLQHRNALNNFRAVRNLESASSALPKKFNKNSKGN